MVRSRWFESWGRLSSVLSGVVFVFVVFPSAAFAAAPQITEELPLEVGQTSATLRAKINPEGKATTYYLEYGTDASYGSRIPVDHELFIGSGTEPVTVAVTPTGLEEEAVYYFWVVATNADGTQVGPAQEFSTLNEDGLAWGRRFELVSPLDKGPVADASWSGVACVRPNALRVISIAL